MSSLLGLNFFCVCGCYKYFVPDGTTVDWAFKFSEAAWQEVLNEGVVIN